MKRKHGVYQDRFVKEIQLREINTVEGANALLRNGFIQSLNEKFARAPRSEADFHRPLPRPREKVTVHSLLHGTIPLVYQGRKFQFAEIESASDGPRPKARPRRSAAAKKETPLANTRSQYSSPLPDPKEDISKEL